MLSIIELLRELSPVEIKGLEQFINSPYHNKSKKIKLLFGELKKFYPSFTDKKFTKENISKKISPSLPYNDSTFRNLFADFQILTEKFLIIEQLFESDYDAEILLLKSLVTKNNNKLFDIHLQKTLKHLKKNGIDHSYFYTKSRLELCSFNNNILNKREKSAKNIEINTNILNNYIICLINFAVIELINAHLKLAVEEIKFNIGKKADFSLGLIESIDINKISQHIKKVDKNNFILDLYLHLFLTFQNIENKQNYFSYKSVISKHYKELSRDELAYHYSMLISYCLIHNSIVQNKPNNDNELFGIYNTFLKEKLFMDKKSQYINEDLFRNILVLSLRLKKYDWTFEFISKYSKCLHPGKYKNVVNLAYAEYYYHMGSENNSLIDLNKAFDYLKEIKEESFVLKYDIKILYLMLYYDLGYIENLLSQLRNYRQFLCRNLLVTEKKKKRLNKFLNILEKLTLLKEGHSKIDIAKLNLDILKLQNFNYQGWLLDKVQPFNLNTGFKKLKHG
ncbi:MAG: hypothetical protein IPM38_16835 [Ignavibacteria bacterium]|nr:hypothetical protein [Ignavibacteria bacterium]